jgi:hypothetical protein
MIDSGAHARSLMVGKRQIVGAPGAAPARSEAVAAASADIRPVEPPATDWRGFHDALRQAALAATQTGEALSLLLLGPAGRARRERHGSDSESDPGAAMMSRIGALAGEIAIELGEATALARYAEQRLAVIMKGVELGDAVCRAERLGRSLAARCAGAPAVPAIGVAQFCDDEPLGHLIERATEALDRARSDARDDQRVAIVVARPGARRKPGACALCPCGLRMHACLCGGG